MLADLVGSYWVQEPFEPGRVSAVHVQWLVPGVVAEMRQSFGMDQEVRTVYEFAPAAGGLMVYLASNAIQAASVSPGDALHWYGVGLLRGNPAGGATWRFDATRRRWLFEAAGHPQLTFRPAVAGEYDAVKRAARPDIEQAYAEELPKVQARFEAEQQAKARAAEQSRARAAEQAKARPSGFGGAIAGAIGGLAAGVAAGGNAGQLLAAGARGAAMFSDNAGVQAVSGATAPMLSGTRPGAAAVGGGAPGAPAVRSTRVLSNLAAGPACDGFTEQNYRTKAMAGGGDTQLLTLCGQAFEYFVMAQRAQAQGYGDADVMKTYRAHQDSAAVANEYYRTHRAR